jgi:hypothetical protein
MLSTESVLVLSPGQSIIRRLSSDNEVLSALAVLFAGAVFLPAITMSILLLAGLTSWWWPALIISSVSLAALWLFLFGRGRLSWQESLSLVGLAAGAVLIAAVISIICYDTTVDGRWYHTDVILALLHNVNPIYTQIRVPEPVWANHYPKACEYFSALLIHFSHNYQLGKIYNFLLIFSCAAYAVSFFRRLGIHGLPLLLLVVNTAFTPIAACQIACYYVDGALTSLLSLLLMVSVSLVFMPAKFDRILFVFVSALAIGVKFTAVAYIGVAFLLLLGVRILLHKQGTTSARAVVSDLTLGVSAVILGVAVLGYTPYVTNVQQGLHPLYPVMGTNENVYVIRSQYPLVFREHSYSSVEKFLISFFSHSTEFTDDTTISNIHFPQSGLKFPFTVSPVEILSLIGPDTRLAGWGVFFSGITICSLILFLVVRGWRGQWPIVFALVLITATSFANPECWWARLAPLIALWPVFLLIPCLRDKARYTYFAALGLCWLLLINNLIFAAGALGLSWVKSRHLDSELAAVARKGGAGEYWAYRPPNSDMNKLLHMIQFSGHSGVVICADNLILPHNKPIPGGGFPVGVSLHDEAEATLVKGSCSLPPPL